RDPAGHRASRRRPRVVTRRSSPLAPRVLEDAPSSAPGTHLRLTVVPSTIASLGAHQGGTWTSGQDRAAPPLRSRQPSWTRRRLVKLLRSKRAPPSCSPTTCCPE